MTDKSRMALELIGRDNQVSWVRDQLNASFIDGVTQSGSDRNASDAMAFEFGVESLSARERNKREKYETSRPYAEGEKIDLIRDALFGVYVTVPALQLSAVESLRAIGLNVAEVAFSAPATEGEGGTEVEHRVGITREQASWLQGRFHEFAERLST
jgi:hypothetical protein